MRQFAIQAVCDEKILWELMSLLEQKRCVGIVARPFSNGAEPKSESKPAGKINRFDTVIRIMRERKDPISPKELNVGLQAAGFVGESHGVIFEMKKRKLVRRVGTGRYVLTEKA